MSTIFHTLPQFNINRLKNDGWNTICLFGMANYQGLAAMLNFQGDFFSSQQLTWRLLYLLTDLKK